MLTSCYTSGQISTRDALKLREKALEGLGLLFIVHPAALMESTASAAMQSALRMTSASCLKLKALTNLLELLKVGFAWNAAPSLETYSLGWHCKAYPFSFCALRFKRFCDCICCLTATSIGRYCSSAALNTVPGLLLCTS